MFQGSGRPWHIAYGAYRRVLSVQEIRSLFGQDFDILQNAEERGGGIGF